MAHTKHLCFCLFAAVALLVACNKEADQAGIPEGAVMLTTEGYIAHSTKTAVNDKSVVWLSGDQVKLNASTCSVSLSGSKAYIASGVPSADPIYGYYPATLTVGTPMSDATTISLPSSYTCSYDGDGNQTIPLPMVAKVTGASPSTIEFKHLTSAVKVVLKNSTDALLTLDSVIVSSSTLQLCGERNVTIGVGSVSVAEQPATIEDSAKRVKINFAASTHINQYVSDADLVEVQVPFWPVAATASDFTIQVYAHVTGTPAKANTYVFSHSASNPTLLRNQLMTAQVEIGGSHTTAYRKGVFSVGPNATDKVYFSQGNLQYKASTNTWRFAENQSDYIGNAVGNTAPSSSQANWIDLFGWGTSGYNNKYPYMTSPTNSDYGNGNTNIADTNYDWGMHNIISNGGNATKQWRTLTKDEWNYLLNTRSETYRYAKCKMSNSTYGLIIFPDGFNPTTVGVSVNSPNTTNALFTSNAISNANWLKMEAAGCVFLPAAGIRTPSPITVSSVNTVGYYWSSSCYYESNAYYIVFKGVSDASSEVRPTGNGERSKGCSVRLVKNANNPS